MYRPAIIYDYIESGPSNVLSIPTLSPSSNSSISCNFIYDNNQQLIINIVASLCIIINSIQEEYDMCTICLITSATINLIPCRHKVFCSKCYRQYNYNTCPICRCNITY